MTTNSFIMMIKGCILALAFSSAYAAENKPRAGGSPNPNQAARNGGVRNYSGPYKAGGSNSGYGRSKVVANNSRWGNRRRRPGRIRRRKPRPANWVRPSRPANWQGPTEPDSYDSGDSYDDTASWADDDYDKCDAKLRSTCCDLPDSLSVQDKKDICYAVGCNYDKCDWSDDGDMTLPNLHQSQHGQLTVGKRMAGMMMVTTFVLRWIKRCAAICLKVYQITRK